ncbi:MAG: hypothetical protein ACTSPE_00665 [Candidatus Thorarchaeota archaeon]
MQDALLSLIRLDLLLEMIAGVMSLAISHFANMAFRISGQKRLSDLSTGFLVLSAAMFGRVIGTWYFTATGGSGRLLVVIAIAYGSMKVMAYLLFLISTRPTRGVEIVSNGSGLLLMLALPILTDPNLDLVAIIVLIMVVLQSVMNYASVRSKYALYVLTGFLLLLLSHIAIVAAQTDFGGYLVSQVLQFLGLSALLVMTIRVGKEE